MKNRIRRIKDTKNLLVKKGSKILKVPKKEVFDKYKVHSVIRLRKEEFRLLKKHKVLTHFNLQSTPHKKGKKYLSVLIAKPGFFDGEHEQKPVLSLDHAIVAACIGVRNRIPYEKLRARDFKHSFENIKTAGQLKKAILKRYCQSMPSLSSKKILSLGVSITNLRILSMQKTKGSNENL